MCIYVNVFAFEYTLGNTQKILIFCTYIESKLCENFKFIMTCFYCYPTPLTRAYVHTYIHMFMPYDNICIVYI